jgi:hypothetical protein
MYQDSEDLLGELFSASTLETTVAFGSNGLRTFGLSKTVLGFHVIQSLMPFCRPVV